MDLNEIEQMLLGTIWGVLFLSACGSIIGVPVIFVIKKSFAAVSSRKDGFIDLIAFPFRRSTYIGAKLRGKFDPPIGHQYVIYCIWKFTGFLVAFGMCMVALAFALIVALVYGIDRPYVLIFSISIFSILFHQTLISGCYCAYLYSSEISSTYERIRDEKPRTYSEARKARKNLR